MTARSIWRVLLLLVLTLPACSATAPLPPKAVALNAAGAEALERGDLEAADARLSLALEYNPRFVEALTNLGLVETQRGNFERARELLVRALRINPDLAQPHHALGILSEREGRPDRAARHYREALAVDPGFAPARANDARLLFEARLFEHARIQFQRLTEIAPADTTGYLGLAESLIQLERVSEAEQTVERGLERDPRNRALLVLEARSAIRRGKFNDAITLLTPLTRTRDDIAVAALSWLSLAELLDGHAEPAFADASRAVEQDPSDPLAVYAMALVLAERADPRAQTWLERAERLMPNEPRLARARTLALRGHLAKNLQ